MHNHIENIKILCMDKRERPQLLRLHGLYWIDIVQKYLKSIVFPEFVYECLCNPTENRQSTNDTIQER